MNKFKKITSILNNISRRKLFFLIAVSLFIVLVLWHVGMDLYYDDFNKGNFGLILRTAGPVEEIAINVAEKGIFSENGKDPTGINSPLYILFVALIMKLFGGLYDWVMVIIQVILAIITGFLIFKIAEKIFKSRTAGLISVILYSIHAELAFDFTFAIRENGLFAFLVLLFVYVLMENKLNHKNFMLASFLAGLAALTRPTGVLFFGILGVWIFYYSWRNKIAFFQMFWRYIVPVTIIFFALVSPWLIYESYTLNSVVLTTSTTSGHNLLYGNNPISEKFYPFLDIGPLGPAVDSFLDKKGLVKYVDEVERDNYKRKLAIAYIKEYPGKFLKMGFKKLFALYSPLSTPMGHGDRVRINGELAIENFKLGGINMVYFPFMIILYTGIIIFLVNQNKIKRSNTNFFKVIFLILLIFTLSHMVIYAESRHRYPFDPLLIIIASGGYYYIWNKINQRKSSKDKVQFKKENER